MSSSRIAIFIDDPNFKAATEGLGVRIDFYRLLNELQRQGHVTTVLKIYFDDNPILPRVENRFRIFMEDIGFENISVPLKVYGRGGQLNGRFYKSHTDQWIVVDIMEHLLYDDFDTLFLFSGDSDYRRVLEKVREHGKQVVVVSSQRTLAVDLLDVAEILLLEDLDEKFYFPIPANSRLSA